MFKLAALVFSIVNGAQSPTPSGVFLYKNMTFATESECVDFIGTDEGVAIDRAVNAAASARLGPVAVKLECVETKPIDDNSI